MKRNVFYFLDPKVGNIENQKNTIDYHLKKISDLNIENIDIYVVGHELYSAYVLEKQYNLNYIGLSISADSTTKQLVEILKKTTKVSPDVVIGYECNTDFLKKAFPKAVVVSESWGALSRFPYPGLIHFDKEGVYNESTLLKNKDEFTSISLHDSEQKDLLNIRNQVLLSLSRTLPTSLFKASQQLTGKKRVLLPLQADGHISFESCCDYKNHRTLVEDFFNKVDPDIDVIITQHPDLSQAVLSEMDIAYFKNKYSNFHYFKELEAIPFVSQWWLIFVDAVATVSSGVAFQAALLGVPVISLGKSHINIVASSDLNGMNSFIASEQPANVDGAIWTYLKGNVFYDDYMFDAIFYEGFINKLIDGTAIGFTSADFVEKFKKLYREKLLVSLLKEKGIETMNYEILSKVIECKALSFDLFDTLVERPFYDPHDLFYLAENKIRQEIGNNSLRFFSFRRKAEEEARKARNWAETTFTQIYYQFKKLTGCSDAEIQIMKNIELRMEETVLTRKHKIHRIFEWGKKLGKKVSIITDIYHDKPTIERFLKAVNIKGYDRLYVSADLDMRKQDGTIYPLYLKDLQVDYDISLKNGYKDILHIGDNHIADVKMAQEYGMRSHHIHKSSEQFKHSLLAKNFDANIRKRWVTDSIVMGMISNRFNDDLQTKHVKSLFGNSLYSFGYMAGGVMMLGFVQHVIEQIRKEKFTKVGFVARDGYIFKDIYDMLRKTKGYEDLPESEYLVLSRRATALAACQNLDDLKRLLHLSFGNQPLEDLMLNRFGINISDIPKDILAKHHLASRDIIQNNTDLGRICELLEDIQDIILTQCSKERAGLIKYLGDKGIDAKSHMCMIDIGYSGTIQQNLNKIYKAKFAGYYMLTHEAPRHLMDGIIFDGWFESYDEQRSANYHLINDYIFFFETLLSSEELSVANYTLDKKGELIVEYQAAEGEQARISFIRETHRGIMDFIKDYCTSFNEFSDVPKFSKKLALHTVTSLAQHPTYDDAKMFLQLNIENKFGGGDASLIYTHPNMFSHPTDKIKNLVMSKSQWKEGARVLLYPNPIPKHVTSPVVAHNNHQGVLPSAPTTIDSMATMNVPSILRKYIKYQKDPYKFFNDSKNPVVRTLRVFYKNS